MRIVHRFIAVVSLFALLFASHITATPTHAKQIGCNVASVPGEHVIYDDSIPMNYSGRWSAATSNTKSYEDTLHTAREAGANVSFQFNGHAIGIGFTAYQVYGLMRVMIDGVDMGTIDQYVSGDREYYSTAGFCGLSNGWHDVQLIMTGQKNPRSKGVDVNLDFVHEVS
jgi:hypothetical protein